MWARLPSSGFARHKGLCPPQRGTACHAAGTLTGMEDPPKRQRRPRATRRTSKAAQGSRRRWDEEEEILSVVPEDYDGEPDRREDYVPPGGRGRGSRRREPGDSRTAVKVSLGQRWSQIVREVDQGLYTWDDFTRTLTAEELVRGQLRSKDGTFAGRPPKLVPRQFYIQCLREVKRRFDEKMQSRLLEATTELIELSREDGGLNPKDRARVLQYLIERVMGPIPKEVHIKSEEPWEGLIVGIFGEAPAGASEPYASRQTEQEEED